MISVYTVVGDRLERGELDALTTAAVWIDLLEPTAEEERAVARVVGVVLPTREAMQEIEASSRLYKDNGAWFVTAPLLAQSDSANPQNAAVTFILTPSVLVTVRHASPQSFAVFTGRALRQPGLAAGAEAVMLGLLETVIDRLADVLERIGADLDALSHRIFRREEGEASPDFQAILGAIGCDGDLASKVRDSLLGLGRIATFLAQGGETPTSRDGRQRLKTLVRDIRSLTEHVAFVSSKINFLLDATLGMINIQQNNIIKIFSVVAVVFLPPTLIASIYGMNFGVIPELSWPFGYPFALALMVLSAILPYAYFKRRRWL